jgi:DUF4097 and DUF4098 domain-containing protein YvlB
MNKMINSLKTTALLLPFLTISIVFASCSTHKSDLSDLKGAGKVLLEKSFQVNAGEKLEVRVVSADVIVTTWAKNEVLVKITGDEDALEKVDMMADKFSGGVKVEIEKKNFLSSLSNLDLKVEITAPASFNADVKTSGGDIKVKDMNGSFALKTSGGNIGLANSSGSVDAGTSGGDVKLLRFKGSANLGTSGGNIEVKEAEGSIEAGTSGGDVYIDSKNGAIVAGTSGGSIKVKYQGDNLGIDCNTSGGDISVHVPESFKADVVLKTSGGSVGCELPAADVKSNQSSFTGKINGGGTALVCKTSGGSISVKKNR